jgi:hypothetical protein
MDSVDVDDVAPPIGNPCAAKCHALLDFSFLIDNSLYFGVIIIMSSQTVDNLGRQHQRSLDSYFESS